MRPYWQQSLQLELDCYTENVICQPQSYITIMLSDYSIFFVWQPQIHKPHIVCVSPKHLQQMQNKLIISSSRLAKLRPFAIWNTGVH